MQYLPGFTVQCINPLCEARGHWLRADATTPIGSEGRCPCCGEFLRNVPPPLGPRFRMRPRSLTARPPLRDRKSTRLNSSHLVISYAVFCLKKKRCGRFTPPTDD